MNEDHGGTQRPRWPRSQRFQLSPAGREAGADYRAAIVASRAESGRRSFETAGTDWAARLSLVPADALYLGELQDGPRTVEQIALALDGCGPQRSEVRATVERLVQLYEALGKKDEVARWTREREAIQTPAKPSETKP